MRSRTLTILCAAAVAIASNVAFGQMIGQAAGTLATLHPLPIAPHYSFEVVSIRPSQSGNYLSFKRTADGFHGMGLSLATILLLTHFPVSLWSPDRIQNAPAWALKNTYDINARVAPQDIDAWAHQSVAEPTVMRAMLLSMLEERCHLQVHMVPAEMPGFALAVSRHGTLLRSSDLGEPLPEGLKLADGGVATMEAVGDDTTTFHFHHASIEELINAMALQTRTLVLDRTGLTGRYDFAVAMTPDNNDHGEIKDPANIWDLRAVGLRTVPTKVPTINIVIDHIEPPSEN